MDAFAGTGQRTEELPEYALIGEEAKKLQYAGSAKKALEIKKPFDGYLFIEKDKKRAEALNQLKAEYPDHYIKVFENDANESIQQLCNKSVWVKNRYRGVIFLDPYGNSVEWQTLEAIAKTKSFDVWFLFPLSGVYRQTPLDVKKLTVDKRDSLNRIFGTNRWEREFYRAEQTHDLFGPKENITRLDVANIEAWIKSRLEDCFVKVTKPLPLPQQGAQMYSLFFCMTNPSRKAQGLAMRVANEILKPHIN